MGSSKNECEVNEYGDLLEEWKAELIVARAKKKGFRGDRIADAQQEAILDVLSFKYDPANEAGASEATALTALIDRKLCFMLRGEIRARRRDERVAEGARSCHYHNGDELPATTIDSTLSRLSVQDILASFDEQHGILCQMLGKDSSQLEMMECLNVCERTVRYMLARVRERFERAGYSEKEAF